MLVNRSRSDHLYYEEGSTPNVRLISWIMRREPTLEVRFNRETDTETMITSMTTSTMMIRIRKGRRRSRT